MASTTDDSRRLNITEQHPHNVEAILNITQPDHEAPLAFAARVLLDSIGLELPLQVSRQTAKAQGGLILDDYRVSEGELLDLFKTVSLLREVETGKHDSIGRFDEPVARWDTSKPWIDLRAMDIAVALGQGRGVGEGGGFQVIFTHDIDRTIGWEPTSVIKALLQLARPGDERWMPLRTALAPRSIFSQIEKLVTFERSHGIGAYFFMMSGPYGTGRFSTRTDIRWQASRDIARLVREANMTVGLHGSFAARELQSYREEKDRLEQAIGGSVTTHRNHYLRFDSQKICQQLETAGISHDFSVGFVSRMGFRAGSAKAYRAFDLLHNRESRLTEIPLVLMDSVLRYYDWMAVLRQLRAALEEVRKVHGCVSLLFHPELFLAYPASWAFFEQVVELCQELGADLSGRIPELKPAGGLNLASACLWNS